MPSTAGDRNEGVADGLLHSRLSMAAEGPRPSPPQLARLPDLMEALHFRCVERSVPGILRCRRMPTGIECRLLGRWTVLSFEEAETLSEARCWIRRWRIGPGLLARAGATDHGSLALGAEITGEERDRLRWRVWSSVEGYPSRFLRVPAAGDRLGHRSTVLIRPGGRLPAWIARLYVGFHRWVTHRYLRRLAARLGRGLA